MIIAIDGPAGSGKSTVAKRLAEELGLVFLDTGAMYRAVAWVAERRGVPPGDGPGCAEVAAGLELRYDEGGGLLVDGEPAEPAIRSARIDRIVSEVAAHPEVRRAVVPLQRARGAEVGLVVEGRDVGTVVFPDADHKFFLEATPAERARRRSEQLGEPERRAEVLAELERRDHADSTRADSPLARADDALVVVTDGLDVEGVVAALLARVRGEAV